MRNLATRDRLSSGEVTHDEARDLIKQATRHRASATRHLCAALNAEGIPHFVSEGRPCEAGEGRPAADPLWAEVARAQEQALAAIPRYPGAGDQEPRRRSHHERGGGDVS